MRKFTSDRSYATYRGDFGRTPSGVSCIVLQDPEHEDRVLKIYCRTEGADDAKHYQSRMAKIGLAPEVFEDIIADLEGEEYKGFSCQKVRTFKAKNGYHIDNISYIKGPYKKAASELENNLSNWGFGDLHGGNFGMIGDKVVLIDFGPDTVCDYSASMAENYYTGMPEQGEYDVQASEII